VNQGEKYEIRLLGWVGERWAEWFDGLSIAAEQAGDGRPITVLTGLIADQAALRGLLNKAWDLNLALLSVTREAAPRSPARTAQDAAEATQ
jgi:hypothetical protein